MFKKNKIPFFKTIYTRGLKQLRSVRLLTKKLKKWNGMFKVKSERYVQSEKN